MSGRGPRAALAALGALRERSARGPRAALAALSALALAAGAGCGSGPEGAAPAASGDKAAPAVPEEEILDYRLIESTAGQRRWVLDSTRMQRFADQEDLELLAMRMDFYRDGVYYSTMTAEHGRANPTTKNLFAWGNVVVTTVDGKRLETQELRYDNATGRITNDVFNRFTRGGDVATGYGLAATPALDYFELRERVDASVTDDGNARGAKPGTAPGAAPVVGAGGAPGAAPGAAPPPAPAGSARKDSVP